MIEKACQDICITKVSVESFGLEKKFSKTFAKIIFHPKIKRVRERERVSEKERESE